MTHPTAPSLTLSRNMRKKSSSNSNVLLSESLPLDAAGASVDPHPNPMSCFPTEERLRQKECLKKMKAAGEEHVEADILFYREFAVFHLICCATRWHAAAVIGSKQEEELLSTMHKIWFSIHGPMQQLMIDGELGVTSPSAQAKLKRLGVSVKVRAPGQHARFIDRRGAILHVTLHCMESQIIWEGIKADMEPLLSEAEFSGNSLVHVGGVTPYQCIYGRSPAMLPPIPDESGQL